MRKKLIFAALMLFGVVQIVCAQSGAANYSIEGLAKTLRQYRIEKVEDFCNGVAVVVVLDQNGESRSGVIDSYGKVVIPFSYWASFEGNNFQNGIACFGVDNKASVFDVTGRVLFSRNIEDGIILKGVTNGGFDTSIDSDGLIRVEKDNQYGYIDLNGNLVIPFFEAYQAYSFHDGTAPVEVERRKTYFIDKQGKVISPTMPIRCMGYSEGLYTYRCLSEEDAGKYGTSGFIDNTGKVVISMQGAVGPFTEGLAPVKKKVNGKTLFGFINKTGKFVIPLQYEDELLFSEGLAPVQKNGKWGYINKKGITVLPFKYQKAKPFKNGVAIVRIDGQETVINKQGKILFSLVGDYLLTDIGGGLFEISYAHYIESEDRFIGLIDRNGNCTTRINIRLGGNSNNRNR